MDLVRSKDWTTLRTMLDATIDGAMHTLKTGAGMEDILRAQGRVQGIEAFRENVEIIVTEAIAEIDDHRLRSE